MNQLYDETAPKKPTNLSINSDLLKKAKGFKINLSATLEAALQDCLKEEERKAFLKNNKSTLAALNSLADKKGLFADSHRDLK